MTQLLAVGLGGFFGAVGRYGVSVWFDARTSGTFPWATLVVNLSGCLLLGALMGWTESRPELPSTWRLFLATGCLGSFTTFSTFSVEGLWLLRTGAFGSAFLYLGGSLFAGLAAAFGGRTLVHSLLT